MKSTSRTGRRRKLSRRDLKRPGVIQREHFSALGELQNLVCTLLILDRQLDGIKPDRNEIRSLDEKGIPALGKLLTSVLQRLEKRGHAISSWETAAGNLEEMAHYLRERFFVESKRRKDRGTVRFRERQMLALRCVQIRLQQIHGPLERASMQLFHNGGGGLRMFEQLESWMATEAGFSGLRMLGLADAPKPQIQPPSYEAMVKTAPLTG